jgi:cell division protein FtsQ
MEDEGPEAARPAREVRTNDSPRATAKTSSARSRKIWTPKLIISSIAVAFTLALSLYAFHVVEQFLLGDSRFALNGIEGEVSTLSVSGATHASERAIEAVFAEDQGRSVYSIPLGERRISLTTVDWVKDASVARLWPNRLWVRVWERTPIAFVMLRGSRFGMIDEDGVILPQTKDRFHLPVLTGVRAADPLEERKVRVQRMLRLTAELGDDAAQLAEIDVTDRDNLKVSTAVQGHVLWMHLGDRHFGLRYRNFLKHFDEIRKKLPGADTFDLRLEDRITAVE